MKKNSLGIKAKLTIFTWIAFASIESKANCIGKEFVTDYCYKGLPEQLSDSSIAVEPKQYGYEASTIVEVMRKEYVQYLVTCESGPKPIQNLTRIIREEKHLISEERQRWNDAVSDLKENYSRLRSRINNYICKE